MAVAATPSGWSDAGLDSAVFSDPRPLWAVLEAIREREAIVRPDSTTWPVRSVPDRNLAEWIVGRIYKLSRTFVDMEYDYAARDWTEFPVMLSERFERGEHPMAQGPGLDDPETDEAVGAWRAFLADCRWWLDRMHVVEVARADYRFGKRIETGGNGACYSEISSRQADDTWQTWVDPTANTRIGDVGETETTGTYQQSGSDRPCALLEARILLTAECEWHGPDNSFRLDEKTYEEFVDGFSYANLRVRNRHAMAASLVLVACAGPRARQHRSPALCEQSEYSVEFEYLEDDPIPYTPTLAAATISSSYAYRPDSLSGVAAVYDETTNVLAEGTWTQTRTETAWSHDFSDSLDKVQTGGGGATIGGHPPAERFDLTVGTVPAPEMMGLGALGPNDLGTIAAGERTDDLLAWDNGFGVALASGSWDPGALHEYENKNERRDGTAKFGIVVVPCLDFEDSFRFKADATEEHTP